MVFSTEVIVSAVVMILGVVVIKRLNREHSKQVEIVKKINNIAEYTEKLQKFDINDYISQGFKYIKPKQFLLQKNGGDNLCEIKHSLCVDNYFYTGQLWISKEGVSK